jgi:hypothetical protein
MADSIQDTLLISVANVATSNPVVIDKRAQLAALAETYYEALDTYTAAKPWLFAAGLLGALLSAAAVTKRRKVGEACVLYSLTGVASAGLAWVARPDALRSAPTAATAGPSWPAARAAALSAAHPGWEAATWGRLATDFGTGTMLAQNPAVQVLLTRNTK